MADIRRVSSRIVYANRWLRLREDEIVRADGTAGRYSVVDKPDFALVIPLDGDELHLVEQYRYPIERRCWEFPQGSWASDPTGGPEELARAELAEETGLRAAYVEHLGHLKSAYGFCSQGYDVFLATGLTSGPSAREPEEQDMRQCHVSVGRFERMVHDGDIVDAHSVAAWTLFRLTRS